LSADGRCPKRSVRPHGHMEGLMTEKKDKKRVVKVESADTACGGVPHMTVDQIAERLNIASKELCCPACGRIHLTEEDVRKAEAKKYSETKRFRQIKEEAEGE